MKGVICAHKWDANTFDSQHNTFTGNATKYRWIHIPLTQTTTLTKAQYAELNNIPQTITIDEEGNTQANPAYTTLQSSYTVPKFAVIVHDDLDVTDEEGNVTAPDNVVLIDSLIYAPSEDQQ